MKKEGKYKIVLVVVVLLLFFVTYLSAYYNREMEKLNERVFPEIEGVQGFTLFDAYDNITIDGDESMSSGVVVALSPGEEFTGILGIRNHDPIEQLMGVETLSFDFVSDLEGENANEEVVEELVLPTIELEASNFMVKAKDIIFFKYTLKTSEDVAYGRYATSVITKNIGNGAEQVVRGGVVMDLAVGVRINLFVSDNPPEYEYRDLSGQIDNYGRYVLLTRARYILAFVLLVLTFYFIYKAYKEDKAKGKSRAKK